MHMIERARKTHIYFNHSPITNLVIGKILELPTYAAHNADALVISTRGQRLGLSEVDEICFEDEQLAQDIEYAFGFFHDAPAYEFEALTVFLPQTRYALGHFLLTSDLVETVHYIEEGVGTMSFGKLAARTDSSARNHARASLGVLCNSLPARALKALTCVPAHILKHPGRVRDLSSLVRFHTQPVHFMWRPEWHARIGKVFSFHEVWPASEQTLLGFPVGGALAREPLGSTVLLLLPPVYQRRTYERYSERVIAFFDGLPVHHDIQVKSHPSDTESHWLDRCRALHPRVSEVQDQMMEAALYCYGHVIPYCFHFNSSSKEYFKFLPWNDEQQPPAVIDLWPVSIRLVDILDMDPDSRPGSRFEFPLPKPEADDFTN